MRADATDRHPAAARRAPEQVPLLRSRNFWLMILQLSILWGVNLGFWALALWRAIDLAERAG